MIILWLLALGTALYSAWRMGREYGEADRYGDGFADGWDACVEHKENH